MPGGRPLKFKTVEELQAKIDAYFAECDTGKNREVYDKKTESVVTVCEPVPYTITGLAIALDTYRSVLCDYEYKDEFSNTIKQAKQRCENYAELRLFGDKNSAGPIFALKNYNWSDKQEHVVEGNPDKPMKWQIEIVHAGDKPGE